ncbi:MAG: vWA domain-containing protein [Planctomycetota bacterium]
MRFHQPGAPALAAGLFGSLCVGPLSTPAYAQNPNAGIAPSGQELFVEITCPGVLDEGDTSFKVSACADLGPPETINVNVLFVLDLSGSMGTNLPNGPNLPRDANGDGMPNDYLDAAVLALVNLGQSLGSSANVDVGVVGFAGNGNPLTGAVSADMSPAGGLQPWVSPPDVDADNDSIPDVEEVVRSARIQNGRFLLFSPTASVGTSTDYVAALQRASAMFSFQPPGEKNIVFFISDGVPNQTAGIPGALNALVANHGAVINAFGIGPQGAAACSPGGPLDLLSSVSGGTCAAVVDPTDLIASLPQAAATQITKLTLAVNGDIVAANLNPRQGQICLNDVEIVQHLDLFGTNILEATAMTADGLTVTATKELVKTACLLFVGVQPDNTLYAPNDVDTWYVKPRLWWSVTEASVPTLTIPTHPALVGTDIYFQVLMHNQAVFPQNAVQMSNGVRVTVGGNVTSYGSATGIVSWFQGSTAPGSPFEIHFDVLAM